jgi:hypothetical protein
MRSLLGTGYLMYVENYCVGIPLTLIAAQRLSVGSNSTEGTITADAMKLPS